MKKRMLAYIGIVGGLAAVTLGLFVAAQYNRVVLSEAKTELAGSNNELSNMMASDPNCLTDVNAIYHDRALWFDSLRVIFEKEVEVNTTRYIVTSVPAYVSSILTLVSFGLVLKDADKQKEIEDARQ